MSCPDSPGGCLKKPSAWPRKPPLAPLACPAPVEGKATGPNSRVRALRDGAFAPPRGRGIILQTEPDSTGAGLVAPSSRVPGASTRRAGQPQGFTFIEVMISLVLLGTVFTLLYSSFFQVSSGTELLQEQLTHQQELRLLLKMISDDLQSAQNFTEFKRDSGAPSGLVAEEESVEGGTFSHIRFHVARPARFFPQVPLERDPEMHEVAYRVESSEQDRELLVLVRREDFFLDDDMDEGGVKAELAERIEIFRVEFLPLARRTEEAEDDWQTEWETAERPPSDPMPMAVRITVGFKDQRGRELTESLEVNLPATFKVGL